MVQRFCFISWKTIWWRNVVLGIMDHCDSKIDLVKYMWVNDLYFMVLWFYLKSLSDLNYFYTLRNGTSRGIRAPVGTCSSFFFQMFEVTWPCPYIVKNFKNLLLRLMTLKLGIRHRVFEYYQCFHMMTLGWPWPFLWQGQISFRMLLHGWKRTQHWVLMYIPSLI